MSDHDVTYRVFEIAGRVNHPGKFENGTNQDELISVMDPDESFGDVQFGAWVGFYTFHDSLDFLPVAFDGYTNDDEPMEEDYKVADALAKFVRSAILLEDNFGFIYVTYWDSVDSGKDHFDSLYEEMYPDGEDDGFLREID